MTEDVADAQNDQFFLVIEEIKAELAAGEWAMASGRLALLLSNEEAQTHLVELVQLRHEIDLKIIGEHDWPEASIRWKKAVSAFPGEQTLWPFAARAFIQNADFDAAEEVLGNLCRHEPNQHEHWIYYARNAESRHSWAEAVNRWTHVVRLVPNDPSMKDARGEAIWHAEMQAEEEADAASS